MRIKKRPTPTPTPPQEPVTKQCHYQVLRLPERNVDTTSIQRSKGDGIDSGAVAVLQSSIAITDYTTQDDLFERIKQEDHWYITNRPARYAIIASDFYLSSTFIVMPDKSYSRGLYDYPKLIEQLLVRPS